MAADFIFFAAARDRLARGVWFSRAKIKTRPCSRRLGFIVVVLPVVLLLQWVSVHVLEKLGLPPENQAAVKLLTDAKSMWTIVYLGVFAVVIAPVAEEFIFRGMLFPFVKQLGFPKLAWFGVSALFALIHLNAADVRAAVRARAGADVALRKNRQPARAHHRARAVQRGEFRRAALANPASAGMNEFELIARLTHALPTNESVVTGAGDDCAVLDLGVPDKLILFKTDAVVEGFHFTRETPPEKIGRKALARVLERHRGDGRHADRRAGDDCAAGKV